MRAALREGRKARGKSSPNPPVGCVIASNGKIVAVGHTQKPGSHHAEAMALAQFDGSLADCEVYVTLEPCAFVGRTPSCAHALADRGARKVFVGMIDPDPRNDGRGVEILRNAGIDVVVGLLGDEAAEDLGPYLLE